MTRTEYIEQLRRRLRVLPEEELRDALNYYDEYLREAGNDQTQAIERLGPPAEVAAQILADYVMKKPSDFAEYDSGDGTERLGEKRGSKGGIKTVWAVLLAVFALPIGLPLAISVAAVAFSLLTAVFAVIFSFGATGVGLIAASAAMLVGGVFAVAQNIAVAIGLVGGALVMAGVGIILLKAAIWMSRAGFGGIGRIIGGFILRRKTA